MKRIVAIFGILALAALPLSAQATGHKATLTWTAPPDAVATSTYNVYRAAAACPSGGVTGTLSFTKITATPITALTYVDSTIGVGQWCYYVTQVQAGTESAQSNTSGGTAAPLSPPLTV